MSRLTEEGFIEVLKHWKSSNGNSTTPFWSNLAIKLGFSSSESLRSEFKRMRKSKGIEKDENRTVQQSPRVLVMDVETLPNVVELNVWRFGDSYVNPDTVKKHSTMLSWSAKFLDDDHIYSDIVTTKESINRDSFRITKSAREIIDGADFVIGHNWNGFDGGLINTMLVKYQLKPVRYHTIDTYSLIKQNLTLPSYKLSYINQYFGLREKIPNDGMPLWIACSNGDKKALQEMLKYNEGDIIATQELYELISPYCSGIPNFGSYSANGNIQSCRCGGKLTKDKKHPFWQTNLAKYDRLVCSDCGAVHRGRKNLLNKNDSSGLVVSL